MLVLHDGLELPNLTGLLIELDTLILMCGFELVDCPLKLLHLPSLVGEPDILPLDNSFKVFDLCPKLDDSLHKHCHMLIPSLAEGLVLVLEVDSCCPLGLLCRYDGAACWAWIACASALTATSLKWVMRDWPPSTQFLRA